MSWESIQPILEFASEPIKDYVFNPLKRHFSYAFEGDTNVQGLQEQVEQLQNKRRRLQHSVDVATRNGEVIFPNVTKWLLTADQDVGEAEELILNKEEAKNKRFLGLFPNLRTRYQLSKNAEEKAMAIDKLYKQEGLYPVSKQAPLQQIVEPSVYSREALPSRVLMLNQVMDALKDPSLDMIGVYGMGGVGKTTLAKEVHTKALQEKLFENVVIVAVSQSPELRRIQGEIADFLGVKFSAEEIPGRASQLHKRLENSKVLIVLDDLWQKLDLNAVGIPSRMTSKRHGCKIMLTSRNRDLLSNEMHAQKLLSLEVLKEEETLSLFQMSVAEAKDPKFHAIATQIAKKCAGLPLLIEIVATELTNKESYEWNNKLNQLSAFGDEEIYEKVYKVLESSYENLPGNEIKSFFLLCALFGQSNIQIQYLLTHSMGLGIFKRIHTVEAARDKVLSLINKLKAKSLLLDGDTVGFVKMHDVVRDTALSIASRVQSAFIGAGEVGLKDWPENDCTRISLPYCNLSEVPVGMDYPKAELFLLFTEDLRLELPNAFFNGMKNLKVVDFRGMRLVSLPSSVGLLTNLQTLCLDRCRLANVGILGELKQLEFLSFANSNVVELPRQIENFSRMKVLDLRSCPYLQVFPAGVLPKLCLLEELYMLNSFVRWDSKGNASLVELESLSHLLTLELQIADPKMIPKGFKCFSRLRRYKISIGNGWDWEGQYESSRVLKLKVESGIQLEDGTEFLLKETDDLYLDGLRGIESIFCEGFPQLKHMHVENDNDTQYLISSPCNAFPVLESLYLKKLQRLEKICSSQLGLGSFGELQILKISSCNKLTCLFSFSSAKCLQKLWELEVESCDNLEAIVGEGIEYEVVEFTQLSSLKLVELPHLIGFCKLKEESDQMGLVSFPNLGSLEVEYCKSLKHISNASTAKSLTQLKKLTVDECESVEEIIQSKKMEEIEEDSTETIVFLKLDSLSLSNLPNLKRFSSCYSVGRVPCDESEESLFNEMVSFPNLTSFDMKGCRRLKYIFTASMVKCLTQLKRLYMLGCVSVEEIIKTNKMEEIKGAIVFPKLDSLSLEDLPNLKRFSSFCSIEFPLLRVLRVFNCNAMGNFVGRDWSSESEEYLFNEMVTFSNLDKLCIYGMDSIKYLWDEQFIADDSFFKLEYIYIRDCSKLSVVFPSNICTRFQRLEMLYVSHCATVEEIYQLIDFKEINNAFSLRELEINNLPSLKHIWNCEDVECGAFSAFQNLQSVKVYFCKDLRYVFPASVGCGLLQLQQLTLGYCNQLEEMISRDKDDATSDPSFQFPQLTELQLEGLKEMRDLYSLQFPKLKSLKLLRSSKICGPKFIPNLEEMEIDEQVFHAIHQSTDELCTNKLKKITLSSFDGETSISIVFGFLSGIKSLEMLFLDSCSLEEIFISKRVKHLKLQRIQKLKHVIKKDAQHLQTLEISYCNDLISIAPSSTCLQNLTTLHLIYCENLINLATASTTKTMVQLMEMKVEMCQMIEEIVAKDANDTEHDDDIIFNKLQYLTLISLPRLNSFCSNKYSFSFPLLEKVDIKRCSRMNVFCGGVASTPKLGGILLEDEQHWEGNANDTISSQLKEWVGEHLEEGRLFQNLESLELVNNAFSSKAISANQMRFLNRLTNITVRDCDSIQVVFDLEGDLGLLLPKLNKLKLINLPMLTQLCNKSPKGILDFNKLGVLKIEKCSRLVYAFTWSMALCLSQLKTVEVGNCEMMETLIVDEEDGSAKAILSSLENVVLKGMPKLSSIYSGRGDLECPSLNKITLMECPSIKVLCSPGWVSPRLIKFSTDIKSIRGMMQFEAHTDLFSNLRKLKVSHGSATSTSQASLVRFLSRLPDLDQLQLLDSSFKDLFNSNTEEALIMPWIKSLRLYGLDDLNKILFPSLETVQVRGFASLENLATLELIKCNQLKSLMTPSMARNMVQLKELTVSYSTKLMEIVGDGSDQTTNEIVFTNLKTLELVGLPSLEVFSIKQYNFKFPSLKEVVIRQCPKFRIFCHGIISAPMLNHVIYDYSESYWEGDLNTTTKHLYQKMVGLREAKDIKLSVFPVLKEKWKAQFPINFFSYLERLEVDICELLSNAIPSHLLQHLESLKVLIVEKCNSVEQVIDIEGLNGHDYRINKMRNLEELQLIDLPRLKQIWSKDPQQIRSYKNLGILKVHNCCSLTFIFNLSMAPSLKNLQQVEVKNCNLVKHIVMIAEEEMMQKHENFLPSLQSMALMHLTNLLSFCSTSGDLECPSLKFVEVVECPNLKLFASTFSEGQDSSITVEDPDLLTAFLGNKMAMPGLEELKVEWKTLKDELADNYPSRLFSKLKCIELGGFEGEECAVLPPTFLDQFLKLEKLALSDAFIEEINLDDLSIINDKDPKSLALLTKLKLSKLPNLKHLARHDCQSVQLFQNLVYLEVFQCSSLKMLVPPLVAFYNLTDLEVSKCDGLINLISASTARSLVQLRRMIVKDCAMMLEIVANASDGEEYEIQFSQLQYLELDGLPFITCFSSGNYDFYFPSLQEVKITGCPNMNNFTERVSVTQKLRKIKTGRNEYDWEWEGSLNDTIQYLYMEKDAEENTAHSMLQELRE